MDSLQNVGVDFVQIARFPGCLAGENEDRRRPLLETNILNQPKGRFSVGSARGHQNEQAVGIRSQIGSNGPITEVCGRVPQLLQMSHYRVGKARVVGDKR